MADDPGAVIKPLGPTVNFFTVLFVDMLPDGPSLY